MRNTTSLTRLLAFTLFLLLPALVLAQSSLSVTFEPTIYAPGNINGQDGWMKKGDYDVAVVPNSFGITSFGAQSLRISNATASGSFGDQTFSKSLANEAGETLASNAGLSTGPRQNHFEAQFSIASTMSAVQPGLMFSVSPDRGDGARMSYLRFEDQADGIHVFFADYQDKAPFGTFTGDSTKGCGIEDDFVTTEIIPPLNRAIPHDIKFVIQFFDGPSNDIVRIYIDGVKQAEGRSWEDYYRYCGESYDGSPSRTVDSLLFRAGGTGVPATFEHGFLIDNLTLSSSTAPTYSCAGFDSPMDKPVTVKKNNRVLPLKMTCTSSTGAILGPGAISPPVLQVTKTAGGVATTPADTYLSSGQGTDGNEFVYDPSSQKWYFNLQTKNFTGAGTYVISAVGGGFDTLINPPAASFIVVQ